MISQTLQEIYRGKSRESIVEAVEIMHEESGLIYRFVKFPEDVNLTLEDGTAPLFTSANFVVKLPKNEETGALDFSISFGLISFDYIKELENIIENYDSRIEVKYRLYTETTFSSPQIQVPYRFFVNDVNISNKIISFSGLMLESLNDTIPKKRYEKNIFRGLKYL